MQRFLRTATFCACAVALSYVATLANDGAAITAPQGYPGGGGIIPPEAAVEKYKVSKQVKVEWTPDVAATLQVYQGGIQKGKDLVASRSGTTLDLPVCGVVEIKAWIYEKPGKSTDKSVWVNNTCGLDK